MPSTVASPEYDDYGNRSKMVANGSEEYETVYDYTVNGKYTALLQKEIKTVKEASSAVTSNNGLAISPTDLITGTTTNAKREETAYSYDANGNQITKITADKTETNTYDGLNQLIGFTDGETTASYKYNADGLRTSKTVDGKTINHIWDGNYSCGQGDYCRNKSSDFRFNCRWLDCSCDYSHCCPARLCCFPVCRRKRKQRLYPCQCRGGSL